MPLVPATIGVVASIKCEPSFKSYFEGALKGNLAAAVPYTQPTYKDGLGYRSADLQSQIAYFNSPATQVGLIVTVGGNVAFNAAKDYANANPASKPFLSLVGAVPSAVPASCWGGVSLESWRKNEDRVLDLINNSGFAASQSISLFYNQNSAMSSDEINDWMRLSGIYPQVNPNPVNAMLGGANNSSDYATSVADLYDGAVIISADPYFHRTREQLIQQLNIFVSQNPKNYVTYPLYNYENRGGTNKPTPGHATLLGPRIEDAITVLGMLAAVTTNSGASPGVSFLKEPLGLPKVL